MLFPNSLLISIDTQVQRRLTTHCRQYYINVRMYFEDFLNIFHGQCFQIDVISDNLICHDGGWIRIDECYGDSFFSKAS